MVAGVELVDVRNDELKRTYEWLGEKNHSNHLLQINFFLQMRFHTIVLALCSLTGGGGGIDCVCAAGGAPLAL